MAEQGPALSPLDLLNALNAFLPPPVPLELPPPSSNLPLQLFNPLFPQIMHQQLMNYNLIQMVSCMLSQQTQQLQSETQLVPPADSAPSAPEDSSQATSALSTDSSSLVVPNDDKEGWCRNKKYIEKVAGGFMCLVCRKVYGRYNSVSYHVTIYHRNPPIKCDMDGCDFTTREARYIHFHKYYRHGVGLPRSIDQGSRRCVFCKHISKSPAMLEKHMKRHGDVSALGDRIWPESAAKNAKEEEEGELVIEESGRCRAISECVAMEVDNDTKPRSFTL